MEKAKRAEEQKGPIERMRELCEGVAVSRDGGKGRKGTYDPICATPFSVPRSLFDGAASVSVSIFVAYLREGASVVIDDQSRREGNARHISEALQSQKQSHRSPHARLAPLLRKPSHDREECEDNRPQRHEDPVEADGAKVALERGEEEELEGDGEETGEGEGGAD